MRCADGIDNATSWIDTVQLNLVEFRLHVVVNKIDRCDDPDKMKSMAVDAFPRARGSVYTTNALTGEGVRFAFSSVCERLASTVSNSPARCLNMQQFSFRRRGSVVETEMEETTEEGKGTRQWLARHFSCFR
mmetsp:Transcript_5732/g.13423  ORF Transcript_5732/g.13423 Transcript_5732/m.13423 type:complete len:132 (-) Transcript_5732:779-1174(-)